MVILVISLVMLLSNRVRVELLVLRKCVDPDENARRVEVHENLCFHSQLGSTSVPLSSPATAGGLLELRGCSSTYIPASDSFQLLTEKQQCVFTPGQSHALTKTIQSFPQNILTKHHRYEDKKLVIEVPRVGMVSVIILASPTQCHLPPQCAALGLHSRQ